MKEAHHFNKGQIIVFSVMFEKSGDPFRLITGNSIVNPVSMYPQLTKHGSFSDHPVFSSFTNKLGKYNYWDYLLVKLQRERSCFQNDILFKVNQILCIPKKIKYLDEKYYHLAMKM
ncbi:MAG: hypothetical protein HOO86_10640 [Bacteroidales bacterium]|nr:hypothetical protein [Bacteroidales bacterium]